MVAQQLNMGQLALNETENIKRQIANDKNKFAFNNFNNQTKNLTATNNEVLFNSSFKSNKNNNIAFSFCFKPDALASDPNYKILIVLNNIVIKDYEVFSDNSHYFQVNFKADDENSLSVLLNCSNQVLFNEIECELLGHFEKVNNVNKQFFVSTQSLLDGVGVINFANNVFNYHYYNNNESFLNKFYTSKTSSVNLDNVLDFCFAKPISPDNSEHPIVLFKDNSQIVLKNLQNSNEVVVNTESSGHHTMFSTTRANSAIIYVSFNGNLVKFKHYNKNFVLQSENEGVLNFNHKISKISAFASSSLSPLTEVCLLVLTENNKLYMVFATTMSSDLSFSKLNKIANAENFYFKSNHHENLVVFAGNNNTTIKTAYKKLNIGYRKLHSKTILNARFGFMLSNNKPVYYFINTFSQEV